jgi:hypothetical protein
MFSTVPGTAIADFESFIEGLPDGGGGDIIAYPNTPWQSYISRNLTEEQVEAIREDSIIEFIGAVESEEGEFGVAGMRCVAAAFSVYQKIPVHLLTYALAALGPPTYLIGKSEKSKQEQAVITILVFFPRQGKSLLLEERKSSAEL